MIRNGCGHWGCKTLKLALSQERIDEINILHADTISGKLKVILMLYEWHGQI